MIKPTAVSRRSMFAAAASIVVAAMSLSTARAQTNDPATESALPRWVATASKDLQSFRPSWLANLVSRLRGRPRRNNPRSVLHFHESTPCISKSELDTTGLCL